MPPLAILLILAAQVAPGNEEPHLTAELNLALGRQMAGVWHPYVLDVENGLPRDVNAVMRLEDERIQTSIKLSKPLARGAKKRFFFYLPVGYSGLIGASRPKFTISDASGARLASGNVLVGTSFPGAESRQIGILSPDKASDRAYGFPNEVNGQRIEIARLTTDHFPDRWMGLASLDLLVLHNAPLDDLSPGQAGALADYVRQGGTLVLSPGADGQWLTHPVLKEIVEIQYEGSETIEDTSKLLGGRADLPRVPFVYHRIKVPANVPPLIDYKAGFGHVLVFPFDFRREPFSNWSGLEILWRNLIARTEGRNHEPVLSAIRTEEAATRGALFQSMASDVNANPPFLLLVALTTIYLACVGPLNYLALRRLRMTLLIVVTVPAISFVFLGLIVGIGYVLKGTSTIAFSARFLVTENGLDCAREHHLYSIFSPATATYTVTFDDATYPVPFGRNQQHSENPLHASGGPPFTLHSINVGQWESWNADGIALRELKDGVRFEIANGILRIDNGSDRHILKGVYCRTGPGGASFAFGEITAGGDIEIPVQFGVFNPMADLRLDPNSFEGRLLAPTFAQIQRSRHQRSNVRQREFLVCFLAEGPPVEIDAFTSAKSRSVTFLQVMEPQP